jgi:metal-responsive CopG/Arc/MetJ family transcriptional regulator
MRTIIDIPAATLKEIDGLATSEKVSRAEVIRRAMTEYVQKRARPKKDAGFGIWKTRRIDALAHEDELRREWER